MSNLCTKDENILTCFCPHCNLQILIYINEINCGIFRHGILKHNGIQMGPHTSKEQCDHLSNSNLIYGCGKPFSIVKYMEENIVKYKIEIVDYI